MSRCEPDRITGGTSRQLRRSDHPSPPRPWPDHTCLISRWAPETRPDDGQAGAVARNAAALRLWKRRRPLPVRHSGVRTSPSRPRAKLPRSSRRGSRRKRVGAIHGSDLGRHDGILYGVGGSDGFKRADLCNLHARPRSCAILVFFPDILMVV